MRVGAGMWRALASKEDDLRVAREACDLYQVDFQRADGERVAAENRAKKAEEDVNTLWATRAQEVEAARERGYNEGFDAARVEYKKQVWEIEAELHRDRFQDGMWYDYEFLLSKLDLPEDSELRAIPEPPPEELALPEELPNPDAQATPAGQIDPNATATADA